MDGINEENVLCVANNYEQKYYLGQQFVGLPEGIKKELKIIATTFTTRIGGIFVIYFDDEGLITFKTDHEEGDLLYDEIGSYLEAKELQSKYRELFESLEMFYKVIKET